jgi:hypothetical protein
VKWTTLAWFAVAGALVGSLGLGGYWFVQDSHRKQESEKRRAQIAKSLLAQEQQREKERQDDRARRARVEEDIKKNPIKSTDLSIEEVLQKGTGTKQQETLEAKYARGMQDAITCRNVLLARLKDPDSYTQKNISYTPDPYTSDLHQSLRSAGISTDGIPQSIENIQKSVRILYSATNSYGGRIQNTFTCRWKADGSMETSSPSS